MQAWNHNTDKVRIWTWSNHINSTTSFVLKAIQSDICGLCAQQLIRPVAALRCPPVSPQVPSAANPWIQLTRPAWSGLLSLRSSSTSESQSRASGKARRHFYCSSPLQTFASNPSTLFLIDWTFVSSQAVERSLTQLSFISPLQVAAGVPTNWNRIWMTWCTSNSAEILVSTFPTVKNHSDSRNSENATTAVWTHPAEKVPTHARMHQTAP